MADLILVTLIHNRKEYLEKALDSAWLQTLDKSKWIHLLVDNASTDGTGKLAENFYNQHGDNVRFVRLPNNLGIQNGHNYVLNDYIPNNCPEVKIMSLLESDDLLTPNALEEVLNMFELYPEIGETYSDFSIIDKNDTLLFHAHPKAVYIPNQFTEAGQRVLRQLFSNNPIGHQRSYSVRCLHDIGGFDSNYEWANDIDVAARMITKYPVVKINKVLYIWRQHDNSASAYNSPKQTAEFWELVNIYKQKWQELGLI